MSRAHRPRRTLRQGKLSGYGSYVRLLLRTNAIWLITAPVVLTALLAVPAAQLADRYPTQADRNAYAAAYQGLTGISSFQGRGYDLTELGGMMANEMGFLSLVVFPVAGLLLAVRLTRVLEETGYLEILTAGRVGRGTPLAGAVTVISISVFSSAALSWLLLLLLGYPSRGSALYAAALALFLLTYAAVGLVCGQLAQTSRQAYGLGLAAFLATYLLRAVIDVRHRSGTWSNPQSWLAEIRPFADHFVVWPWLAYTTTVVTLLAVAVRIAARRDVGAGVLAPRPGPATSPPWTAGALGLAVRLSRGTVAAWLIGAGVFAFAFGALGRDMQDVISGTQGSSAGSGIDGLVALFTQIDALFAAAVAVQVMTAWAAEERTGRLGWILSTTTGRVRSWLSTTGIALFWALLTLSATGLLTGAGLWIGLEDPAMLGEGLRATIAYAPAVVLVTAVTALLASLTPAAAALTWAWVLWGLVVAFLGEALGLSEEMRNISPFEWTGRLPLEDWAGATAASVSAVACVAVATSTVLFRRRDLVRG